MDLFNQTLNGFSTQLAVSFNPDIFESNIINIIHNCQVLQRKVETVRIGDRLTFRIEIPEKTPYGIFARCEDKKWGKNLFCKIKKILNFELVQELRGNGQGLEVNVPNHR